MPAIDRIANLPGELLAVARRGEEAAHAPAEQGRERRAIGADVEPGEPERRVDLFEAEGAAGDRHHHRGDRQQFKRTGADLERLRAIVRRHARRNGRNGVGLGSRHKRGASGQGVKSC